jgi:hypothetical protein
LRVENHEINISYSYHLALKYMHKVTFFTIIIFGLTFLSTCPIINAEEMQGDGSVIQLEDLSDLEITQINEFNANKTQTEMIKISTNNTDDGTKAFILSISPLFIDYGILSPTNPIIRSLNITVLNLNAAVYTIFAKEDHPLTASPNVFIPNTNCDNGACSEYTASSWTNTLSFGLGYRCDNQNGNDCDEQFQTDNNNFKQFSDSQQKKQAISIMEGTNDLKSKQTEIIHKVNIAASQPPGAYHNTITYILIAGY